VLGMDIPPIANITRRGFIGTLAAGVAAVLAWPFVGKKRVAVPTMEHSTNGVNSDWLPGEPPVGFTLLEGNTPIDLTAAPYITITRRNRKTGKIIREENRRLNPLIDDPVNGMVSVGQVKADETIEFAIVMGGVSESFHLVSQKDVS